MTLASSGEGPPRRYGTVSGPNPIPWHPGFFDVPRTILLWGPDRAVVHRLTRAIAGRFDAEFSRLSIGVLAGEDSEPDFADLPPHRNHVVRDPATLLPSAAALDRLDAGGWTSENPRETVGQFPPALRSALRPRRFSGDLRALLVTDSDRLGPFTQRAVLYFGAVDRLLKSEGIALVVGHAGDSVPNESVSVAFDCILREGGAGLPGAPILVTPERGSEGHLLRLGSSATLAEVLGALGSATPAGPSRAATRPIPG